MYCDACGRALNNPGQELASSSDRSCVACGRAIDLGVYFTVCPHCGFNYRIEITPVRRDSKAAGRGLTGLYIASAIVPIAGFVIGALMVREGHQASRRAAAGCVALGALNMAVVPLLMLRYLGLA